jgi:hypothetical protein
MFKTFKIVLSILNIALLFIVIILTLYMFQECIEECNSIIKDFIFIVIFLYLIIMLYLHVRHIIQYVKSGNDKKIQWNLKIPWEKFGDAKIMSYLCTVNKKDRIWWNIQPIKKNADSLKIFHEFVGSWEFS